MKEVILKYERNLQNVSRNGKTYADLFCGGQFLLVKSETGYEVVGDGLLDDWEVAEKVYRLNIFGKLVEKHSYKLN